MMEIKNLTKLYKNGKEQIYGLKDINLSFPCNGMFFLCGKSGSGKSTLLNLIGLLDKPDAGKIIFNNKNICALNEKEILKFINSNIGFIFQDNNLIKELNVKENISLPLKLNGKSDNNLIDSMLRKLDIAELASRKISELSGGQKQRVAIARALVRKPCIILCDEPTASLDSENTKIIFDILKEISKTRLVIIASHNEECAKEYADGIVTLKDGQVISNTIKNEKENVSPEIKEGKKSRLDLSMKLKLFFRGLLKRPFRFISMLLAMTISLGIIGFFANYISLDETSIIKNSMQNHHESYFTVKKNIYEKYILDDKGNETSIEFEVNFSEKETEEIENKYHCKLKTLYDGLNSRYANFNDESMTYYYPICPDGYLEFNEDELSSYGLKILYGNMPQNDNELCITDYQYYLFSSFGYTYSGENEKIDTYEDIIGKNIELRNYYYDETKKFVISGIIDTSFNFKRYEKMNDNLEDEYRAYIHNGIHNSYYLKPGYYDKYQKNVYSSCIGEKSNLKISSIECSYKSVNRNLEEIISFKDKDNIFAFDNYDVTEKTAFLDYFSVFESNFESDFDDYAREYAETIYNANEDTFAGNDDYISDGLGYYFYLRANDFSDNKYITVTRKELINKMVSEKIKNDDDFYEKLENASLSVTADRGGFTCNDIKIGGVILQDKTDYIYANEKMFDELTEKFSYRMYSAKRLIISLKNGTDNVFNINNSSSNNSEGNENCFNEEEFIYKQYKISNEYSESYLIVKTSVDGAKGISKYVMLVLIPLTILLVYYYFSGIVLDDEKKIGILKACGCSENDLKSIYVIGGAMISLAASALLSIIMTILISKTDNIIYGNMATLTSVSSINIVSYILLLISSFALIGIGLLIPLRKIAKKKIVNNVKE